MWLPISSNRHFKSMRRTTWQTKISSCHIMAEDNERQCRVMGLFLKMRQGRSSVGQTWETSRRGILRMLTLRPVRSYYCKVVPQVQFDTFDEVNHTVVCI